MATRTSSKTGMRSSYENTARDDRDDMRSDSSGTMRAENRGGSRLLSNGIHVSAAMPDTRTARITIDIDWEKLVSRVAHKVGQKLKGRRSSGTGSSARTRRTTSGRHRAGS